MKYLILYTSLIFSFISNNIYSQKQSDIWEEANLKTERIKTDRFLNLPDSADSNYIIQHYKTSGGREPPPTDHQGIDDAFLEKTSVVHFFYNNDRTVLSGAD